MTRQMDINMSPDEGQAQVLMRGLERLPAAFLAELCGVCDGAGKYEQTYTAGCGGGYFRSIGPCDYCRGFGLTMNGNPAPLSVVNQVTEAARD